MKIINSLLFAIVAVTLVPCSSVSAETDAEMSPKPVLAEGDVKRFIETFPAISKKLEALGKSMEQVQDPSQAEAMMANEKVQAILQQHGWKSETFFPKLATISMGFAQVKMTAELAKLPAEQRAMMEQMMQQQMGNFDVHPEDLALIEPHLAKLEIVFESM